MPPDGFRVWRPEQAKLTHTRITGFTPTMISDHWTPSSKAEPRADAGQSYCGTGRARLLRSVAALGALLHVILAAGCEEGAVEPQEATDPAIAFRIDGTAQVSAERAALVALYEATNGGEWRRNRNWLTGAPLGDWYGVSVDSLGRVTALSLSYNRLSGKIPAEIGGFSALRHLYLEGNELAGAIPPELGYLAALRSLAAGHNELTGSIPPELGSLDSLEALVLSSNLLTGPIPAELGNLGNLTGLGLSNNYLSGQLPTELGRLGSLLGLYADGNNLEGPLPRSFAGLGKLHSLRLGINGICAPGTRDFHDWLSSVENHDLVFCNAADRAILWSLWRAAAGDSWARPWIFDRSVEDWPGVTVDSLGRVTMLDLAHNGLRGIVPSSLGQLRALHTLRIDGNSLLQGRLPLALMELQLREFRYGDTGLCTPAGGGFSAWLRSIRYHDGTGYECPPMSDRSILEAVYAATGGPNWGQGDNWLTDAPLDDWYGVSADRQGRVTALRLGGNGLRGPIPVDLGGLAQLDTLVLWANSLSGPIPAELGDAVNIRYLGLDINDLTGTLPDEVGLLTNLTWLGVGRNPQLVGPLPSSLTNLTRLFSLAIDGTGLCAPSTPRFRAWLEQIDSRVPACDQTVPAYLTQEAGQTPERAVPLIAGREALLRVFPIALLRNHAPIPEVRAEFWRYGRVTHVASISGKPGPIPTRPAQSLLRATANAEIPGRIVQPGLEMVVYVDPGGTLDPALGVQKRIPATGRMPVDVQGVPRFDLTLIPFLWRPNPDSAVVELIRDVARDPPNHDLLSEARRLLPIDDLRVSAHEPVLTSSRNAVLLLAEVAAMRAVEGGTDHYMGVMADLTAYLAGRDVPSNVGGVSYVAGRVSVAQPHAVNVAHELGHNLSLAHAPGCFAPNPDPRATGAIGAWGYDFDKGGLVSPSTPDLMSWCDPVWISGYHFTKALRFRQATGAAMAYSVSQGPSLLLWGGIDRGEPFLEPAFVIDAPTARPNGQLTGEYRIAGLAEDDAELFSLRFDMPEVADAQHSSAFAFVVPVERRWADRVTRIVVSGPGGSFSLDADEPGPPLTLVRNPRSGQLRAFLRDQSPSLLEAMEEAARSSRLGLEMETIVSRGIPAALSKDHR